MARENHSISAPRSRGLPAARACSWAARSRDSRSATIFLPVLTGGSPALVVGRIEPAAADSDVFPQRQHRSGRRHRRGDRSGAGHRGRGHSRRRRSSGHTTPDHVPTWDSADADRLWEAVAGIRAGVARWIPPRAAVVERRTDPAFEKGVERISLRPSSRRVVAAVPAVGNGPAHFGRVRLGPPAVQFRQVEPTVDELSCRWCTPPTAGAAC